MSTTLAGDHNGHLIIPGARFEQIIVQSLDKHIRIHSILEIEPPYFLLVSVLGVEAHNLLSRNDGFGGYGNNPIDRNDLLIPEILVEDNSLPSQSVLKPAFDALWNSAGQPESPFYDCHGNWNPT